MRYSTKHIISFVALSILVVLAFGSENVDQMEPGSGSNNGRKPYEIRNTRIETGEYGNKKIVGILENISGSKKSYIQIQFTLYNDEGVQVGSTMANTNNLDDDGKWKFEAMIMEEEASDFEVESVTGF